MSRIGMYCGSFDPITNGHTNIISKALNIFDLLYLGVAVNSKKSYLFSIQTRLDFLCKIYGQYPNVRIVKIEGLTTDFCEENNITSLVRGIRNPSDFIYEKDMMHFNKSNAQIETVFFISDSEYSFISSTFIREFILNGKGYEKYIPKQIVNDIT